jgi:trehalose synthase
MAMSASPDTAGLQEVDVEAIDVARLEPLVGTEHMAHFEDIAEAAADALSGRAVLNINSTATGGGVAEMLQTLLAYARGGGVDARWLVIEGDPEFFAITKRIHNGLYGSPGDLGDLGPTQREHYEAVLRRNAERLLPRVRPGDIAIVHDPQPAGLAAAIASAGARVVWRCHVGVDEPNEWSERSWGFLRPYLEGVDGFVFSRAEFAPPWAEHDRTAVIPPSLDPFGAKNEPISRRNVRLTLQFAGLIAGGGAPPPVPFRRRDGSPGHITRHAAVVRSGPAPALDAPLVVQASRWDWMKDMAGVMEAFAQEVDPTYGAHLVLAGPSVTGVADDPEAALVFEDCVERWGKLPQAARDRVHLAAMPMTDNDEQASIVNALQRHAAVVTQKSIAEGFGLTVTEAMWKARPVVATAVGGITSQIVDGVHGLLVDDPFDLKAFGAAINSLLADPARAEDLGRSARTRVTSEFLADRHLEQYAALFGRLQ